MDEPKNKNARQGGVNNDVSTPTNSKDSRDPPPKPGHNPNKPEHHVWGGAQGRGNCGRTHQSVDVKPRCGKKKKKKKKDTGKNQKQTQVWCGNQAKQKSGGKTGGGGGGGGWGKKGKGGKKKKTRGGRPTKN